MISCEAKPRLLHHLDADKAPRVPAYNGELNNPKGHMKLYTKRYRHYCGIDLHARTMHVCWHPRRRQGARDDNSL
jgi:hypothetical protein